MARIGFLIVLLILATCTAMPAQAKNYPTQGLAAAGCNADGSAAASADKGRKATGNVQCDHQPGRYTCTYEVKPYESGAAFYITCANMFPSETYHDYPPEESCSAQPGYTGQGPWSSNAGGARSGSLGCRSGCDGVWYKNGDGSYTWTATGDVCPSNEKNNCQKMQGYYWNPVLNVCEPPSGECPEGGKPNSLGQCAPEPCPDGMAQQQDGTCKKKDSECPAGEVRSPDGRCLPGDGQCAKGEVRGPDGTCKKDSDNDGQPDDPGEKDTFAGGDDCSMPPSCSGSPILCGQARIQWRIDCNTRKNRNIAGGSCSAMPVCTGEKCDAMEYAGLLMQWRTACAAEKLASQGNNNGGDGAQPEWTKVGGMSTDPGLGASPDDTKVLTVKKLGVEQLDQSGFGGGGSCIGFAVSGGSGIGSGFAQAMASPPGFFCDYIILIRAVIILGASVTCAFILTSGGKN